jgi:hypothetical protein
MSATPLTDATIVEANKSGIFRAEVIASMSRQLELDRADLLAALKEIVWQTNRQDEANEIAQTAIDKITSRTTQIA